MSKSAIGWLLVSLGGIGLAVTFVKFVIIGYYPDEALPFGIVGLLGIAAVWVGDRFRKQSALDSGEVEENA